MSWHYCAYVWMHICAHMPACTHTYTHRFWGLLFFPSSSLFSFLYRLRQRWTMSLRRLSDSSIQVMLPRHIPMRCPTAESSYGFEPKQGVAIPLPACPLLSAHCSTVEEQGFKWTGGVWASWHAEVQYTLLPHHRNYNSVVRFQVQVEGAANGGHTLDAAVIPDAVLTGSCLAISNGFAELEHLWLRKNNCEWTHPFECCQNSWKMPQWPLKFLIQNSFSKYTCMVHDVYSRNKRWLYSLQ